MSAHTTFHIGGPADYFITAETTSDLALAAAFAREKQLPIVLLGGGSNMLVSDEGLRAVVVHVAIAGIEYETEGEFRVIAHVGGGVSWDEFVADSVHAGYWGVENLSAIPGTVGATPVQNVGAYGVEVGQLITAVSAIDMTDGTERTFTNEECAFGYRSSFFKTDEGASYAISRVSFRLSRIPTPRIHYKDLVRAFGDRVPTLTEVRDAVIMIRSKKFPDWRIIGTAGSFFKNPRITQEEYAALAIRYPHVPAFPEPDGKVKVQLGWILDKALNLRGAREGNVGTYENQSLVLVNFGGALARDVDAFARGIEERVQKETGICIAREVRMYPEKK